MNTKIEYLYRGASNYKKWNEVIIIGEVSIADKKLIKECLYADELFIPERVGLPLVRPDNRITVDDHCYAELNIDDIFLTHDESTILLRWGEIRAL